MHTSLKVGAAGLLTLLSLSGCSLIGGGDEEAEDRLTLNDVMGVPDYENIDYEAQENQIQELLAACMTEKGWEYIPVDYPDTDLGTGEMTDDDQLEWVKEHGLGISYWTLHQNDETEEPIDDPWADFVDPNQEIVDALTDAEREAYYADLYGEQEYGGEGIAEGDAAVSIAVDSPYGSGCQGEAYEEVYKDDPTNNPGYWEAMQQYYDDLNTRVQNDPRMVELKDKWSKCMKKEDLDYADPEEFYSEVYTDFQERHDEILGPDYNQDPFAGWSQDEIDEFYANATEEELNDLWKVELTDDQRTQLEALLEEEIVVAVAEYQCSKDLNEKGTKIYEEIEEQYVLEHEDELRALAAELAAGGE